MNTRYVFLSGMTVAVLQELIVIYLNRWVLHFAARFGPKLIDNNPAQIRSTDTSDQVQGGVWQQALSGRPRPYLPAICLTVTRTLHAWETGYIPGIFLPPGTRTRGAKSMQSKLYLNQKTSEKFDIPTKVEPD